MKYKDKTLLELINEIIWFDLPFRLKEIFSRLLGITQSLDTRVTNIENTPIEEFIPLSGTIDGNLVTGGIGFTYENERNNYFGEIVVDSLNDSLALIKTSSGEKYNIENENYSLVNPGGFKLMVYGEEKSIYFYFDKGWVASNDFSEADPTNKQIYAQRSYVDSSLPQIADNFADDTAAAIGGVEIGRLYHTAGAVKVRLT